MDSFKHFFLLKNFLIISTLLFTSCNYSDGKLPKKLDNEQKKVEKIESLTINKQQDTLIESNVQEPDSLELSIINAGLIDIQTLDPSILVDLKYSSTDNFMNKNVYGKLKKAYLQADVAASLVLAQQFLKSQDSSLTLLVYDAVRPRSVQQYMWDYLDLPINEKIKFVSNPKNGSIHNFGSAVDLTIAKNDGTALDMGAKYDEIEKIAYPRLEATFLAAGELTEAQINNRKLLRKVMKHAHFTGISTEWWHFNRYSRSVAKTKYTIIE